MLTAHLLRLHLLLRASGVVDEVEEIRINYRAAIEPHAQHLRSGVFDLLIDAARYTLEWLLDKKPSQGRSLIERWAATDAPWLHRLAIYGMAVAADVSANAKLQWLLDRDWLYAAAPKHEVFRLLAGAYPQADERLRALTISTALEGVGGERAGRADQRAQECEKYDVLAWLSRKAPECGLARAALERVQAQHPDFAPRPDPDLDTEWSGARFGPDPALVAKVRMSDPEADADLHWLLNYALAGRFFHTRDEVHSAVQDVTSADAAWGLRLARALCDRVCGAPTCGLRSCVDGRQAPLMTKRGRMCLPPCSVDPTWRGSLRRSQTS